MNWWCSATNTPWSWEWRAYPGVWLIVLLLGLLYFSGRKRALAAEPRTDWGRRRVLTFLLGLFLVWGALDWPIGTLGGGYLASMHSVQWLLLSQVAPPFLILGVPPDAWRLLGAAPKWKAVLHRAAGGIFGLVVFNGVLLVTHVPAVTDLLMASQLGRSPSMPRGSSAGWRSGGRCSHRPASPAAQRAAQDRLPLRGHHRPHGACGHAHVLGAARLPALRAGAPGRDASRPTATSRWRACS